MSAESGQNGRPVRSSVDALTATAADSQGIIDAAGSEIDSSVEEIVRVAVSELPRDEAAAVESAVREIAGDMARVMDELADDVGTTFDEQATELRGLLQPDDHDPVDVGPAGLEPGPAKHDSSDADLRRITLPDGTVIVPGAAAPDPVGWEATATVDDEHISDDDDGVPQPHAGSAAATAQDEPEEFKERNENRSTRRSASQRAKEAREIWLGNGNEIGNLAHEILVEPNYEPPKPPPGLDVNDPVTALSMTLAALWEALARSTHRRRGR
ncbi:hypothetical protein [Haloactinopolyspora alba]|nr:hypothetical protein [Haloactinopolyspora alba]